MNQFRTNSELLSRRPSNMNCLLNARCVTNFIHVALASVLLLSSPVQTSWGQFATIDIEAQPLKYTETDANNRVSKLVLEIEKGGIELDYEQERGNLRSLLGRLEISESSQVLVFSKTSMQVQHISPRNPRAIYFNDDTYVGWIPGSSLVEISTNDPKLGVAFYTLQMSLRRPQIRQETYNCLACHATSMTQGVPGHTVRSGFPNYDGRLALKKNSFVTDHTSDFSQRWGGWYVTGTHGDLRHMGNTYLRGGVLDMASGGNRQSLDDLFDVDAYLTPHSDIHALMILEHQTQMHNTFTRSDFSVRVLQNEPPLSDQAEYDEQLRLIAKGVVDRLLFCNEFQLTSTVSGTSGFDKSFVERGPQDSVGRSLREFDMRSRMFKYPLSYLVHSEAFDSLQSVLRSEIGRQLKEVLEGRNAATEYRHLTLPVRQEILEIIKATKPGLLL